MSGLLKWLREHIFEVYLVAALLMAVPPAAMYLAAQRGAGDWTWALLSLVVLGNLLVLWVR